MLEEAENTSREIVDDLQDEVKRLQDSYRKLQNKRDTLLREIKNIADGFLEQVNQARSEAENYNIDEVVKRAKNISKASYTFESAKSQSETKAEVEASSNNESPATPETPESKPQEEKDEGSFFDSLD